MAPGRAGPPAGYIASDVTEQARPTTPFDEAGARRLLLLRACETAEIAPALWSPEDRAWASRLARETAPAQATPAQFLALRARHACERLLARDAGLAALARPARGGAAWALLALLAGTAAGLLADSLGDSAQINLLAPPLWALVTLDARGQIVPSDYARIARANGLDLITWTLERSGTLTDGGGFYYQSIANAVTGPGDTYRMLDVLVREVGVIGVFSDWPATVTYYANCMGR